MLADCSIFTPPSLAREMMWLPIGKPGTADASVQADSPQSRRIGGDCPKMKQIVGLTVPRRYEEHKNEQQSSAYGRPLQS